MTEIPDELTSEQESKLSELFDAHYEYSVQLGKRFESARIALEHATQEYEQTNDFRARFQMELTQLLVNQLDAEGEVEKFKHTREWLEVILAEWIT